MARIKVLLPEHFTFSTPIPVRITDINYGGHVGNDALLSIIHEARLQFLSHHGYSEMNMEGTGLIMADAAIEFKAEAFYGDILTASVGANDFTRIGFDLCYKLEKNVDGKMLTVAVAKTGMVCYNYDQKKVAAIPASALARLQQ
ncbi:MAG TPA: thioesterase family protein [Niabella sp.]|nr:thioesterase family protein [Niabella sp.]